MGVVASMWAEEIDLQAASEAAALNLTTPMEAEEGEEAALECNASRVIEYSDLCLGADPPPDCYPGVKVGRILAIDG